MFNSLVKKNEKFDYVPDLASDIQHSDDYLTFTFTIRDGVSFHDGSPDKVPHFNRSREISNLMFSRAFRRSLRVALR